MPVRLRLDLAYDGTAFHGWAVQPGLRTVQGVLEDALATVLRAPAALTVAGRTDAGVHARGQVAHLDVPVGAFTRAPGRSGGDPAAAVRRRVTGVLAREATAAGVPCSDVVVRAIRIAEPGFDARFSAVWRRYRFRIADSRAERDPLRRDTLWVPRALDADAMNAAGVHLLGEHDFLSFCKPREGATTIRELQGLSVARRDGDVIEIDVTADAFCHSMVRAIVGALMDVGEGRRDVGWPRERLELRSHDRMAVAPPGGLTLEEVGYPVAAELAERARVSRAVRVAPGDS